MSKPLFIHIPKSAGNAIYESGLVERTSYNHASEDYKKIEKIEKIEGTKTFRQITYKHLPYQHLDLNVISSFNKKFAVVRNPWSRIVSMYNYSHKIYPQLTDEYENLSFKEYVKRSHEWIMTPSFYRDFPYKHWAEQNRWVISGNKTEIDIIRYENLNNDISLYLGKNVTIPLINKGTYSDDYRSYYDDESYEMIEKRFKIDIDKWGFTFESGATRNYWKVND